MFKKLTGYGLIAASVTLVTGVLLIPLAYLSLVLMMANACSSEVILYDSYPLEGLLYVYKLAACNWQYWALILSFLFLGRIGKWLI